MTEPGAGRLPPSEADWAALPADLLAAVFLHVLRPASSTAPSVPLRPLLSQLFALFHTCRHWAAVAAELPLDLELYAASPACRAWLAGRRLRRLRLASCAAGAIEEAAESALLGLSPGSKRQMGGTAAAGTGAGQQQHACPPRISGALAVAAATVAPPAQPLRDYRAARAVGWSGESEELFPWVAAAAGHCLTFDGMLQELGGVTDWSTLQAPRPKTWALSAWTALEELSLEGPVNWHGDFATFDAAALTGLTRLKTLRLSHFYGYTLGGLPPSLRRLRLHFEPCLPQQLARLGLERSLSLLTLPEDASLDELVVVKREGWVAFSWSAVSRACRRLVLHNGLREAEQRGVGLAGVALRPGDDPGGRHLRLVGSPRVSPDEQAAAQAATLAAWLRDFKCGSASQEGQHRRITELCCALSGEAWAGKAGAPGAARRCSWLDAPLLLLPVSEGAAGLGAAEEQLRRYHASLAQALLDEDFFPALPAEVPPEWFSPAAPQGLEATALSSADSEGDEPVLVALRSHAHFHAGPAPATLLAEELMADLAV